MIAKRKPSGEWDTPQPVAKELNTGYVNGLDVGYDGSTFVYTSRADRKEQSQLMFARRSMAETWYLPEAFFVDKQPWHLFQPRLVGNRVYCIRQTNKKIPEVGDVVALELIGQRQKKPLEIISGEAHSQSTSRPIVATIDFMDPTSRNYLGRYQTTPVDGSFGVSLLADRDYLIDVRAEGHSFANYILIADGNARQLPTNIELFDTIRLEMQIFDADIFRPLESHVTARRAADGAQFAGHRIGDGIYEFRLPLGSNYDIEAQCRLFSTERFTFRLGGDIVFSRFMRFLPLKALKRQFKIRVVDAETREMVEANIELDNQSRDERLSATTEAGGNSFDLRIEDIYRLSVCPEKGYSFSDSEIDMKQTTGDELTIELIALKTGAAIRLNNVNFASASAELSEELYAELDRLVEIMKQNPDMQIELAAHTDNVGRADYNLKLSDRRAASVMNYLLDNGLGADRLSSHGYGMTQPLVPNTSDENKALNRRVEFRIVSDDNTNAANTSDN